MEPIERVVERAEREAEAQFRLEQMTVCEQAGEHVFVWGRATCLCGETTANGS
jgi:hypothetical protein